ncbi:MAG: S-layer domain protein [Bacillota bacterium]|jgi:hypothetical protein|nr:S-layer domain protein [Bacillota bacterium]
MKKEWKGFLCGVLATSLIFGMSFTVFAETAGKAITVAYRNIKIYVDGAEVETTDVKGNPTEAFLYNGTTYLPVRGLAAALGKDLAWDGKSNRVYIGWIPEDMRPVVTVSTAEEFLKEIGSNKKIVLKPGVYNLSAADEGRGLTISNVSNLTIEGVESGQTEFVVDSRYAQVMNFINCKGITIKNIKAGHTPSEYECDAGVLLFDGCSDVSVSNSELYGCGSIGVTLQNTNGFYGYDLDINHCSLRAIEIHDSKNVLFQDSIIRDHEAYSNIVYIARSESVTFRNSDFKNNKNFLWSFFELTESADVLIEDCRFEDNSRKTDPDWENVCFFNVGDDPAGASSALTVRNTIMKGNKSDLLTSNKTAVTFENCTMSNNTWK